MTESSRCASRFVLSLAAAFALLLTACGDDSSESSDTATTVTAASGADDAVDGTVGGIDLGDATGVSDECATVAEAALQVAGAAGAALTPGDAAGDVDEFFGAAGEAAPDELRDDFEVLSEVFAEYGQILEDVGADLTDPNSFADPQVAAALQEAVQGFSTSEFQAAADNISAWAEANC